MVDSVFGGREPWDIVPARYRPPPPPPVVLTPEQREIALSFGLENLGRALRRN